MRLWKSRYNGIDEGCRMKLDGTVQWGRGLEEAVGDMGKNVAMDAGLNGTSKLKGGGRVQIWLVATLRDGSRAGGYKPL